jgi:hypothetical protein
MSSIPITTPESSTTPTIKSTFDVNKMENHNRFFATEINPKDSFNVNRNFTNNINSDVGKEYRKKLTLILKHVYKTPE